MPGTGRQVVAPIKAVRIKTPLFCYGASCFLEETAIRMSFHFFLFYCSLIAGLAKYEIGFSFSVRYLAMIPNDDGFFFMSGKAIGPDHFTIQCACPTIHHHSAVEEEVLPISKDFAEIDQELPESLERFILIRLGQGPKEKNPAINTSTDKDPFVPQAGYNR